MGQQSEAQTERRLRSSSGVKKDVSVLQVLGLRAQLEMFLEGVAALDGRDGTLVDLEIGGGSFVEIVRHCCLLRILRSVELETVWFRLEGSRSVKYEGRVSCKKLRNKDLAWIGLSDVALLMTLQRI